MKTKQFLAKTVFACLSLLWLLSSCSVDDRYDTSKDFDKTIGIGKGLSLPIGSTEKIMLSEFIDPSSTEVLEVDEAGNYSITANGSFNPESFKVNEVDIALASKCSESHYDFNLNNIVKGSTDISMLPPFVQEQIKKQKYPYVVYNDVNYTTSFDINQNVPEEMKMLSKMTFKEPARLELTLKVESEDAESDELLELTDELKLLSDEYDGFVVEVPSFLVFADGKDVVDGKLVLDGSVKYDKASKSMVYSKTYEIIAIDFSSTQNGPLQVENGKIVLNEVLQADGYVKSDTVYFGYDHKDFIAAVEVKCEMAIGNMSIKSIEGIFNPVIDPVVEMVGLDFGDDLDFLKEAYMDVCDPCIYVTFANPVAADINANASFVGLDDNGMPIEGAGIYASLCLEGGKTNNIFIDMHGRQVEGYTNCVVENLDGLLKHMPSTVEIALDARIDTSKVSEITLGEELEIAGSYEVSVPLEFDSLKLEYTYSIEDVFGDDAEMFKNVKDINGLSLSFDVHNTLPVGLVPEIVVYGSNNKVLKDVKLAISGGINKGKGVENGVVAAPVKSSVKVSLEAHNGRLNDLNRIDIKLVGVGSGVFNANEYLQLKDINVSIDDYITLDLND